MKYLLFTTETTFQVSVNGFKVYVVRHIEVSAKRELTVIIPSFLLTEPDPPKTFTAVFINITSVLISWSAYTCNDVSPSAVMVRYRRDGATYWIERMFKILANKLILTGQFHYNTAYEFKGRLVYDGRVGAFSRVTKTRFPAGKYFQYSLNHKPV